MGRSSSDFEFWEETLPVDRRSCGASFEGQRLVEDREGAYSPPLWTRAPVDCRRETSRLLPRKHEFSCLSPASRLRAIVDGRRELMEMIQDLPESSYELTLKDIVDDQQNMEEVQEKEVIVEEKKLKHKTESGISQNSQKTKNRQICRTESMESEVFLLKMFLPASLSSKKKPKTRKHPKPCPGKSLEGSEKRAAKNWWKTISLALKDKQNTTSISRSTSDISSNRTREYLDVFSMVLQQGELQVERTKGVPVLNKFNRVSKYDHWNSPNKENQLNPGTHALLHDESV
ncbi:hypothetical protein Salat_2491900 [Sesamum alatum]|uniref:Uncharacterized protein n=1 Tax=Sesamum alatum TaxID=300844 RepID=A0AAE1XRG0_9LAMI|nr:hypothetical protein Salat_2491900 [Sesamum alatum]